MLSRAAHYPLSTLCVGASIVGCELGISAARHSVTGGARANRGLPNLKMRLPWRSH